MTERKEKEVSRRRKGKMGKKGKRGGTSSGGRDASKGLMTSSIMSSGFNIRTMPLFPWKTRRTLTYQGYHTITSGAAALGNYVYSANSIYDPDVTGTGGTPMGFAKMMNVYNHFTVANGFIRVVFLNNSVSLRTSVGLSVSGTSTVLSSIEQLMENGDLTFQMLEFAGAFGGTATLKRRLSNVKYQGLDNLIDDPNMRGDAATSPLEQTYFHLSVWNPASVTTVSADVMVYLEYDTIFHEPRKLALG
jgi:hypothetical protein